ncbi:hypothetical protein JD516_03350 [Aeromonas jandaei]|uniref:hypothetical protein n=1 Tax=Aeromonas jandaei TaxID=650 RepID=UPI00191D6579|nr:hypothetical protein [Aeromonas jandaei]MBL0596857.1 hypothetical protein [Aeromonas jandaei]
MSNTYCFKMGLAALLDVSLWVEWLGILANLATFFGLFIAGVAAIYAIRQHKENIIESRRSVAYELYQNYLSLCFEHPEFARGFKRPTNKSDKQYERYCWFISSALFAFEQILHTESQKDTWSKTIKYQLSFHKEHLIRSSTVRNELWDDELQKIIDRVINQP